MCHTLTKKIKMCHVFICYSEIKTQNILIRKTVNVETLTTCFIICIIFADSSALFPWRPSACWYVFCTDWTEKKKAASEQDSEWRDAGPPPRSERNRQRGTKGEIWRPGKQMEERRALGALDGFSFCKFSSLKKTKSHDKLPLFCQKM